MSGLSCGGDDSRHMQVRQRGQDGELQGHVLLYDGLSEDFGQARQVRLRNSFPPP